MLLRSFVQRLISPFGLCLQTRADRELAGRFFRSLVHHGRYFEAQLGQDLMADMLLGGEQGFFVEFGALDGLNLSNTHFLEVNRGWKGILAEPARKCHQSLKQNRPNSIIDTRCVWSSSEQKLEFCETNEAEYSTLAKFASLDGHADKRAADVNKYEVETVSLNRLLRDHNCPQDFDFLSVDTEGSELEILAAADFEEFHPRIIAVEHNYQPSRKRIFSLLTKCGYERIMSDFSWWDDWYVDKKFLASVLERFRKEDIELGRDEMPA